MNFHCFCFIYIFSPLHLLASEKPITPEECLGPRRTSTMKPFFENSYQLLGVNFVDNKAPS